MRSDTTANAIVRSTFGLAHSLGMRVVAEGVEDDDTWSHARRPELRTDPGLHALAATAAPAGSAG